MIEAFSCLALFEDEAYRLYELLREKAEDEQVKLLLDLISQETRMHRELLRHLSHYSGNETTPSLTDCGKELGELFTQAHRSDDRFWILHHESK